MLFANADALLATRGYAGLRYPGREPQRGVTLETRADAGRYCGIAPTIYGIYFPNKALSLPRSLSPSLPLSHLSLSLARARCDCESHSVCPDVPPLFLVWPCSAPLSRGQGVCPLIQGHPRCDLAFTKNVTRPSPLHGTEPPVRPRIEAGRATFFVKAKSHRGCP